jgi:CRISPR-associated exonuclease Cas4
VAGQFGKKRVRVDFAVIFTRREKTMVEKFEEMIDKIMEDFLTRSVRERQTGKYYPSELHFCIRQLWLSYKQPKMFNIDTLKLFESGSIFHNWFREVIFKGYLNETIKDFDYEGSLVWNDKDIEIRGRFDDIIVVEWESKPILLEVKSSRSLKFTKDVKAHHLMQINFYLSILKLPKGYVIYLDRSNLQHKIFEVKQSSDLFNEVIKRAKMLHKHLTENKIPFPESKLDSKMRWNCDYCLYRMECLKAGG